MSYYCFNRKEILQKAKGRYSKEEAPEYYAQNKEPIKEKSRDFLLFIIKLVFSGFSFFCLIRYQTSATQH